MNTSGEAAEQIVRMSLEGFEVAARITGAGAKNIAILLYSILKEVVLCQDLAQVKMRNLSSS